MKLREANGNVIKTVEWNGDLYTFTNTFKRSNTKSHDILTMRDSNGNEWQGETTWINRPWHRFDLEEAFDEIVSKAFGPKALKMVQEIDKEAYSVEDAIDKFFAQLKPEDIEENPVKKIDSSTEGRKNALAKYLEVEPSELEEVDENTFEYDDAEYKVLTDDEAEEEFDYAVRSFWDDVGLDGVNEYFRDWVLENAVDSSELEDYVREDISDYYYELDDEDIADEAIDEGLVDVEDVYNEESDEYSPELRDDVDFDDLREQLIEEKFNDIDNYAEYLRDMGFGDDFFKDYIDEEAVIEALKDDADVNGTGRGQELAYYDGQEIELDGGLFAYRTN